jgi:hypothetical protein
MPLVSTNVEMNGKAEYPDSPLVNALRLLTAIGSGALLPAMIVIAWRTRNYGFWSLSTFVLLSAIGEADQVGRPFVPYQLPLRVLGLVFAAYWASVKAREMHAHGETDDSGQR